MAALPTGSDYGARPVRQQQQFREEENKVSGGPLTKEEKKAIRLAEQRSMQGQGIKPSTGPASAQDIQAAELAQKRAEDEAYLQSTSDVDPSAAAKQQD